MAKGSRWLPIDYIYRLISAAVAGKSTCATLYNG